MVSGPDFDNGKYDTVTTLTGTVFQDSVITSSRGTGLPIYHALGWTRDPFAGTTSAASLRSLCPTTKVALSAAPDSLVLVLPYSGFTWGDTTTMQTHSIRVFALTDSLSLDSSYYAYSSRATDPTVIGTATLVTNRVGMGGVADSVALGTKGIKRTPHLRIRLSDAFRDKFVNLLKADSNYPDFRRVFPGLYIMADSSGLGAASLPYFRLNGGSDLYSSAALLAYVSGNDSVPVQFPYIETYAAHFNRIRRNYTGFPAAALLDKSLTQPQVAMQNAPGFAIDLQLPFIQYLPKNVIINKAEITFAVVPTGLSDDKFFGPQRLYVQGINSSGGQYTIADRYPVNDQALSFIDGTPSSATRSGTALTVYRINIPREVQQAIVAGSTGLHLRIGGTANFPAAYRVVFGGRGNTNPVYRPTINIIYSKQ